MNVAAAFGFWKISRHAEHYIKHHFAAVTFTKEFLKLDGANFLKILRSNEIVVVSEEQVFEAAFRWAQHDSARNKWLYAVCVKMLNLVKK